MCFRPSALQRNSNDYIQLDTCPSCGQPVAAQKDVTSGTCPYCGKPIPKGYKGDQAGGEVPGNTKIL